MPKRNEFKEDSYYHIYNRGLYKQTLFHDLKDFQRFMYYIDLYREKCEDDIGLISFCILPNHFHLVIKNKTKSHRLSYFVGNLCVAYSRYYKHKYSTGKGSMLFEGRFRSKYLDNKDYIDQCIRYVEYNPLKHGLVKDIEDRMFSSYDKNSGKAKPEDTLLELDREFDF